ncbi:hypothetical protein PF008_g25838 [Phytophthora fragariae]|uniref:ZSWIM1/3 RNaseH-like domain-containing protein n=1 Tax=Phytophthora fragariae TaxID=53985 RepID=A0A6G0QIY5_9STRA|nr:hypothetical protein PF008_g25838 [Phytophthora fragariae]
MVSNDDTAADGARDVHPEAPVEMVTVHATPSQGSSARAPPATDPPPFTPQEEAEVERVRLRVKKRQQREDAVPQSRRSPSRCQTSEDQPRNDEAGPGDSQARVDQVERWESRLAHHLAADNEDNSGGEAALAEVLAQLEEEDNDMSPDNSDDSDYNDERGTPEDDDDGDSCDGSARASDIESAASSVPTPKQYQKPKEHQTSKTPQGPKKSHTPKVHQIPKANRNSDKCEDEDSESQGGAVEDVPVVGGYLEGCPMYWSSWKSFYEAFDEFQEATYQRFPSRTSTSIKSRNKQISAAKKVVKKKQSKSKTRKVRANRQSTGGTLLPESWEKYSRTFVCTHGIPYEGRGEGLRQHDDVRFVACTARINARVCSRPSGVGFHIVVKAKGTHSHSLTERQWYNYAENRRILDPELRRDVSVMSKAGAKPRGILAYLRSKTGKRTILRDVHNMIQDAKKCFKGGRSDAERAVSVLDEFCEMNNGNVAEFVIDKETNVVQVITFQSARQKRLFAAFPEVVLVDSTHNSNANRYKLFSFAVHDVFGKGQFVQHALVRTKEKPNLALAVAAFKKHNPEWSKIRVVMSDKALHEKELSNYAFDMVAHQYKLAVGSQACYDMETTPEGKARVTNPATGNSHVVDARLAACDLTGGLNRINCPPRRAPRALSSDAKYSQGKQITEKIVDVLSIQPSTTHKLAMQWLTGFYDALHTGKLEEFTGQNLCATSGFNALSQVSSVGSVTVSQLSFADTGVRRVPEDKPMCDVTAWTDLEEKAPVPVVGPTPSQHGDAVGRSPADPITLASPPKRKGLTRRAEKHEASTGELQVANKLRLRISEGRKSCAVKLSYMAILKGPYSRRTTMPFIERLSLPSVEVAGKLDVRSFNIGQPVPVTKAIPQLEKIEEAIAAIDNKSNKALLARWEDYGFATYGQLKLMARVIKERNKFKLVEDTMKWIDSLAFRVASITPPFKDMEDVTKVDHKQAEDDLNLGRWYVGRHEQNGCEFLDFRENLWLHSGSIIGGLLALQSENLDVAIVNPRFHDFDDADQKMRTAK